MINGDNSYEQSQGGAGSSVSEEDKSLDEGGERFEGAFACLLLQGGLHGLGDASRVDGLTWHVEHVLESFEQELFPHTAQKQMRAHIRARDTSPF